MDIVEKLIIQYGFGGIIIASILIFLFIFLFFLLVIIITEPDKPIKLFWGIISVTGPTAKADTLKKTLTILFILICSSILFIWYFYPNPIPKNKSIYYISEDEGTMRRMIEAEAEAVNNKDNSIIKDIYASDAVIEDVSGKRSWSDPAAHYENVFKTLSFSDAVNYSVRKIKDNGKVAVYTCASRGRYNGGEYNNPPGSNEWTFRKNSDSCWVIVRFKYNIPQ